MVTPHLAKWSLNSHRKYGLVSLVGMNVATGAHVIFMLAAQLFHVLPTKHAIRIPVKTVRTNTYFNFEWSPPSNYPISGER